MPFCRQLDLAMFNFRDRLSPFSTSSAIVSCNKHLHWAFPKVAFFWSIHLRVLSLNTHRIKWPGVEYASWLSSWCHLRFYSVNKLFSSRSEFKKYSIVTLKICGIQPVTFKFSTLQFSEDLILQHNWEVKISFPEMSSTTGTLFIKHATLN